MSFAKVYSAQTLLLSAHIIEVEVDISRGLHAFSIVGLPDKAVEEAKDRVSAAIKNSGYTSPKSKNQKIVFSLAPADLRKEGPHFDLAMALAYLKASDELAFDENNKLFIGELALDGSIRSVNGVLPLVRHAKKVGFTEIFVPKENAVEAALISDIVIHPVTTLVSVTQHLEGTTPLPIQSKTPITTEETFTGTRLEDISGQESAKRGLEIAAAGGHNIVLYGPPGTGKTMLARAFKTLLPPLSFEEVLEVTAIHSVAGALKEHLITESPFRSPHHTASYVSIIGGGTFPKPGEATLAHRGVLFLDEFPEFERRVIDSLRQPIEEKEMCITRAKGTARFPANFILIAAMNPCPCGNFGSEKECICTPLVRERYQKKISGPIIDRVDMWIEVPHIDIKKLENTDAHIDETIQSKQRIEHVRTIQKNRFATEKTLNGTMSVKELKQHITLTQKSKDVLHQAAIRLDLSPRAYHRVVKLARTIADLDAKERIEESHILEAIQYRPKQVG